MTWDGRIRADARAIPLADSCVQCVVTSPPYWGLRDYGNEGQLGLEKTPQEYVDSMLTVFREVWRVLKPDGVLWLNLGDSYSQSGRGGNPADSPFRKQATNRGSITVGVGSQLNAGFHEAARQAGVVSRAWSGKAPEGLKPKDLVGIPWRVAFALQADGWFLRSDVIWAKKNCMPESVTDRPTRSHEYIFLLTKGQSRTRAISILDVEPETVHLSRNIGAQCSYSGRSALCIAIAAALFDLSQEQENFSLPPFYSEKWKKRDDSGDSDFVSSLPSNHRMAAHSARLLNSNTSTKEFLGEVYRFWGNLTEREHFLIRRGLAESIFAPRVFVDGDAAIGINDAGKVCKIDFLHGLIIDTVTTGCNYYYDSDAIKEEALRPEGAGNLHPYEVPGQRVGENSNIGGSLHKIGPREFRNKRSVWSIATSPYPEAHYATFPEEIPDICIRAGSRPGDLVLDPFFGSGTVGKVAERLSRRWIGIDLGYQSLQAKRVRNVQRELALWP